MSIFDYFYPQNGFDIIFIRKCIDLVLVVTSTELVCFSGQFLKDLNCLSVYNYVSFNQRLTKHINKKALKKTLKLPLNFDDMTSQATAGQYNAA